MTQAIFEPNRYLYKYPSNLILIILLLTPPMKMEQTECFETSEHKIQMPGNHQKERILHSEHSESLKPRIYSLLDFKHSPCHECCIISFGWFPSI
jgi:hypothetical protein